MMDARALTTSGGPAMGEGHGGPSRGYSWPPAKAGNVLALKDGADSERFVSPLASLIAEWLIEDRPERERFPVAIDFAAHALARVLLIRERLDLNGIFDEEGQPRETLLNRLDRAESSALRYFPRLGLDAPSYAALVRDIAEAEGARAAVDRIREQGRIARERRELEDNEEA